MQRSFKVLLVCSTILSLGGCKTLCPPTESIVIHDTTTVEKTVTYHDTVFKISSSMVTYTLDFSDIDQLKFKPVLKSNKNAKLTAQVVNKSLVMGCYCDSASIKAQLKNILIKVVKSTLKEVTKPPVKVEFTPTWIKILAWIGAVCLVIILLNYKI